MTLRRIRAYSLWFINLMMSLVAAASVVFLIWDFDYFEDLYVQLLISILASIIPLIVLIGLWNAGSEFRRFSLLVFGFMILSVSFLAIGFGGENDLGFLVLNAASVVASVPWLWFCWEIARKNQLLLIATIPTLVAWFIYLVILVVSPIREANLRSSGALQEWDVLLIPLPFVSFTGSILVFLAWRSLICATNSRERPVKGPVMESITMFLLIVPFASLVMFIVDAVTHEAIWVAVAGILVGFLFSNAISTPFGHFLRALGGFDENRRGPIREPHRHRPCIQ